MLSDEEIDKLLESVRAIKEEEAAKKAPPSGHTYGEPKEPTAPKEPEQGAMGLRPTGPANRSARVSAGSIIARKTAMQQTAETEKAFVSGAGDTKTRSASDVRKKTEATKQPEKKAPAKPGSGRRGEKNKKKNLILNILLVIFVLIFLGSGFYLVKYYIDSKQNKELVHSLKEMIDETGETGGATGDGSSPGTSSGAKVPEYVTVGDKKIQRKFRNLYEKNPDFVGWLTIEGTNVDLPVMYTPDQEQKYLRKNFDGDYALAGTPFIASRSDPEKPTTNVIIYGHNMKDGSMFSDLLKYKDEEFYQAHKQIHFNTIYKDAVYEVIAAFPGQVLNVGEEGFRYYEFFEAYSAEEFDSFVNNVKSLTTYNIPATATFGNELITLSTCEDSGASEGKRYVVVARKVE